MNYVDFFGHKVSKLIVGDNPFNGHSYIPDFVPGKEMVDYHTEDKILEAMFKMEELGINTMLPLADPYIIRILQHYRNSGGKMNFIFQTYAPMMFAYESVAAGIWQMLSVDPIGIYISGTYTDVRLETGRKDDVINMIKFFREKTDVKLGIGTHVPEVIEMSEREGWNADFYLACMYNFRRKREGEESGFITGRGKSGTAIFPEDRPVMLETLKKINKPVIAFKIFAGGQMLAGISQEEKEERIKDAYETIFASLKPNDLAAMGIFQKHNDQLAENVKLYNEWYAQNNK